MLIVIGILLMFKEGTSDLLFQDPVVCKFKNISGHCYVAEGQELHLIMPLKKKLTLTKNKTSFPFILKYNPSITPQIYGFTTFKFVTDNETLILNSVKKNYTGIYNLEAFYINGTLEGTTFLQLNVEAQVSSVKISSDCLSPKVMKVSCSANGDDLRFKWTSDYNTPLANGSNSVEVDRNHQGNVTCHVENHISRDHTSIQLHPCPETTTMTSPAITSDSPSKKISDFSLIIMSSIFVLLIIISVVALYIYKKTHGAKNKEAITQEGRELVYAQVNHSSNGQPEPRSSISQAQDENVEYAVVNPQASKRKQKTSEAEVHYGELVFNTSGINQHQAPKVEDCIYSQVQHRS